MKIENVTITVEACKNFQKYGISLTASEVKASDFEVLKNSAITEAIKGINKLTNSMDPVEVKTTVNRVPNTQTRNAPPAPKATEVSDKQKKILLHAGYNVNQIAAMSKSEAANIIKQIFNKSNNTQPTANNSYTNYQETYGDESY